MKNIRDLREIYSVNNVCKSIDGDREDVYDLIENKQLDFYVKIDEAELLGYERQDDSSAYIGRARIIYSGLVRILDYEFFGESGLLIKSFSLNEKGTIKKVIREKELPPFIPQSFIERYDCIEESESCDSFEYCSFPTKELMPENRRIRNPDIKCVISALSEEELLTIERNEGRYGYFVRTDWLMDSACIRFLADEVNTLISPNHQTRKMVSSRDLIWNNSLRKNHPLKKIIERVYLDNRNYTSGDIWEIIWKDHNSDSIYDVDCSVENIGSKYIELYGRNRSLTFKTFENYLTDCRNFYKKK